MTDFERSAAEREAARLERERRRARMAEAGGGEADGPAEPGGDGRIVEPYAEDLPIGIRRVSRQDRGAAAAPRAPAARRPPRRRPVRRPPTPAPRRRRWIGRVIALVPLALAAVAIWFAIELYQPFHGSPHGQVIITVPRDAGASEIGNLLAAKGVVSSGFFFNVRALLAGDRGKLLSGTYRMQLGMSYAAALKLLITPPPAAKVTEITTTPGHTRAGLDALLSAQGIRGYLAGTVRSPLLDPTIYGAPRDTPSLEGFLFPDTYQLRLPVEVSALIADQLRRFKQEFATVDFAYARSQHLTPYDVLIIASLVQAEGQTAHDMPLVASVIFNRLRLGMMLQFDSTTRYATGNFTRPLTESELHSPSPWNTHTHAGLPPTPINNPDLQAIDDAANPARTNDLYFVSKPCSGALAFSSSYTQFLSDVAAFNATQSQNGAPPLKPCRK